MGDLIEFTTPTGDEPYNYKISNAMKFYLKGKGGPITIGLQFDYTSKSYVLITIGNQYSWIYPTNKVKTMNMLSEHTYKPFWISVYGNEIRLGEGNNPKPFLVGKEPIRNNTYITFTSFGRSVMSWKLRLPPIMKPHRYKKINGGQLKWVKMDGNCLPEDALIGGYEDEVLYIMRAMHEQALTPGKFVPSKGAGYVAWGSDAHKKTDMEILCGYDGVWVPIGTDEVPAEAFDGGFTEYYILLFVGRALHNKNFIPGKVEPVKKICYISCEGKSVYNHCYEVLIVPNRRTMQIL